MNVLTRTTQYCTPVHWHPVVAGVVHDTETAGVATPHSGGSWNYQIARDGTVYHDVDETRAMAWHVRAADRWRPAWVQRSPYSVSDVNYCAIGLELVSCQSWRDAGEPYTQAQYDALAELCAQLDARYGGLWWVGHGELQTDRSDPVAFDWARAGFSPLAKPNGRWFLGPENVPSDPPPAPEEDAVTVEQQLILDAAARHGLDAGGIDQMAGINVTLSEQVDSLLYLLPLAQAERDAALAEVDRLKAQAAVPAPSVNGATVYFTDGSRATLHV